MKFYELLTIFIGILVTVSPFVSAGLTDAELYYSFDDDDLSGSNPIDLSANGNDGINDRITTGETGVINQSFDFPNDGTAEIQVPDESDYDFLVDTTEAWTIAFWSKPDGISDYDVFVSKGDISGGNGFELRRSSGGVMELLYRSTGETANIWTSGATTLTNAAWNFVAFTHDGAGNIECFIGDPSGGDKCSHTVTNTYVTTANSFTLVIGEDLSQADPLDGWLDELGIWNEELSGADLSSLYAATENPYDVILTMPSIEIVSPANNYHTAETNISFITNITDPNSDLLNCSFYINSTITQTLTNTPDVYKTWWNNTLSEGIYSFNVTCTDGNETNYTETRVFVVDRTNPLYTEAFLATDNTTSFLKESLSTNNFTGYWSDNYMYAWNYTITAPNNTIMSSNETTGLTGSKEWINFSVDMTGWTVGTYIYEIWGSDDHTAKKIPSYTYYYENNKLLGYIFPDGNSISIENSKGNLKSISTVKELDRYTFSFEPNNNRKSWTFILRSQEKLNYREKLYSYPVFVTGNNWVDFNLNNELIKYEVTKVNDYEYLISIETPQNNKEKLSFKSVGGLNTNNYIYSFDINNNNLPALTGATLTNPLIDTHDAVFSSTYTDAEGQAGTIYYYWSVNGTSVYNDTDLTANNSPEISTLLTGNFSTNDNVSVMYYTKDLYNSTSNATEWVVAVSDFFITAIDAWTSATLNNFQVYIPGLGWYNTTTGVVATFLPVNSTSLYDITIYSSNYVARSYNNFNLTALSLEGSLYPYNSVGINFRQTNGTLINNEQLNLTFIDEITSWTNTTSTGILQIKLISPSDHELRVETDDYIERNVFFTVTDNSTQNLTVYLLTADNTTEIQNFRVLDTSNTEVSGAVIWVQKEVLTGEGNFVTVNQIKTNSEGETSVYIIKGINEYYRFAVTINNSFKTIFPSGEVYTDKTFFIAGVTTTAEIKINLEETTGGIEETYSITTSLDFYNTTNIVDFNFTDAEQAITGAKLEIWAKYIDGNNTFIKVSENTSTSTEGRITGAFTPINNTVWEGRAYIIYGSNDVLVGTENNRYDTDVVVDENLGLLIAILIFSVIVLLTLRFGATVSLTAGLASFWITKIFVFIDLPSSVISTLIVFGFILFFKMSGGND